MTRPCSLVVSLIFVRCYYLLYQTADLHPISCLRPHFAQGESIPSLNLGRGPDRPRIWGLLSSECHPNCNFRFKTNEKVMDPHLTLN